MAGPTVKGDLKFNGYTQTRLAGTASQVLTYRIVDGKPVAEWQDQAAVSGLAREAACFFYLSFAYDYTRAPVFAKNNTLPIRLYDNDTKTYTMSETISTPSAIAPCRDYDNTTAAYVDNNIPLQ